jgi:hypothetical protein
VAASLIRLEVHDDAAFGPFALLFSERAVEQLQVLF